MEYHVILTLTTGADHSSTSFIFTHKSSATRGDLLNLARQTISDSKNDSRWLNAPILFFSAEPNSLG